MKLHSENGPQRLYVSEVDSRMYEIRAETYTVSKWIETSKWESKDPADKADVEAEYVRLRLELSVHFADDADVDLIGEPTRAIGVSTGKRIRLPGWPGGVPAIALLMWQAYWPPAPEEPA